MRTKDFEREELKPAEYPEWLQRELDDYHRAENWRLVQSVAITAGAAIVLLSAGVSIYEWFFA